MLNRGVTAILSDKASLTFLTSTDHVELVVSLHLVFLTKVNLLHFIKLD